MLNWKERIDSDPAICHGRVCIKGTRVMVSVILDSLAAGESPESLKKAYHVESEDIQAALQYAAELARDRVLSIPLSMGKP